MAKIASVFLLVLTLVFSVSAEDAGEGLLEIRGAVRAADESVAEHWLRPTSVDFKTELGIANGRQSFEIIDNSGRRISKLIYPLNGYLGIFSAKARFKPGFALELRYGGTRLSRMTGSDQDWLPDISAEEPWLLSEFRSEAEMEFYDAHASWRVYDSKFSRSSHPQAIPEFLFLDRVMLDLTTGVQHEKGYYRMTDGVWKIVDYTAVNSAFANLDSYYRNSYTGFRLGFNAYGTRGPKFSSDISLIYSLLKSNAEAYWNLRNYSFWQSGTMGIGMEAATNFYYEVAPRWTLGVGYRYMDWRQPEASESGRQPTFSYDNWDIVRNIDAKVHGFNVSAKYGW